MGLELDARSKAGAKRQVVVDFAVHGEGELAVLAHEGLCTSICTRVRSLSFSHRDPTQTDSNNGETFVAEYGVFADITP